MALKNLVALDVGTNNFAEHIPQSLCSLTKLE
jgi:hypothetical protein